jgi:3-methyladenine DNA glycosylase/8-oxoguanine DNA glycosylase
MQIVLKARAPFSLPALIRSHGWVQLAPFSASDPYHDFRYVDRLHSGRVVIWDVRPQGNGVLLAIDGELAPAEQRETEDKARWMLGMDQELDSFYNVARQEPKLAHVVENAAGRILRSPTLFEDTVKTILTTNTAWSGTIRMVRALVELYGEASPGDPTQRAFPTPERLAQADVDALRGEARLGYRAPYIHALAERVAHGELDLEALKTADLPTGELRKELLAIKGIGAYAAANLLMLLGRTDFLPIDSYALKMVSGEFYGGEPVGPQEVEAAFERWGEWKGMAYWFWEWAEGWELPAGAAN